MILGSKCSANAHRAYLIHPGLTLGLPAMAAFWSRHRVLAAILAALDLIKSIVRAGLTLNSLESEVLRIMHTHLMIICILVMLYESTDRIDNASIGYRLIQW